MIKPETGRNSSKFYPSGIRTCVLTIKVLPEKAIRATPQGRFQHQLVGARGRDVGDVAVLQNTLGSFRK